MGAGSFNAVVLFVPSTLCHPADLSPQAVPGATTAGPTWNETSLQVAQASDGKPQYPPPLQIPDTTVMLRKKRPGSVRDPPVASTCDGEICHVHDSDHSMHMALHPNDIGEVLRKGWGQRHPLAPGRWPFSMPVPQCFVADDR